MNGLNRSKVNQSVRVLLVEDEALITTISDVLSLSASRARRLTCCGWTTISDVLSQL